MSHEIYYTINHRLHSASIEYVSATYHIPISVIEEHMNTKDSEDDLKPAFNGIRFWNKRPKKNIWPRISQMRGIPVVPRYPFYLGDLPKFHREVFVCLVELFSARDENDLELYYHICACSYEKMTRLKRMILDNDMKLTDDLRFKLWEKIDGVEELPDPKELVTYKDSQGVRIVKDEPFWRLDDGILHAI